MKPSVPRFERRELVQAAACAVALALPTLAQSQGIARVAWVSMSPANDGTLFFNELRNGLRELGLVEGRNLVLDAYWGDYGSELLNKISLEAIASRPHVIVAHSAAALTLRRLNPPLPIVFGFSGDPVEAGLVQSMARPGGNLTGISFMQLELVGKRMHLLKALLPHVRRVAVVTFPRHAGDSSERRVSEVAASALGLTLEIFEAQTASDVLAALAAIEKSQHQAVMLFPVHTVIAMRERIAAWSIRARIPTASGWAQFAEGGNLMSFGPNLHATSFRLASFVDRILKGAKPAELPVEQPVRVELVVNARTAKALGVGIPSAVLLQADRVIE